MPDGTSDISAAYEGMGIQKSENARFVSGESGRGHADDGEWAPIESHDLADGALITIETTFPELIG
jgi:hypothetical protein